MEYSTTQGGGFSGAGHAIPLTSLGVNRGGLFWFFTQDNPELLVKVLPLTRIRRNLNIEVGSIIPREARREGDRQ